MNLKQFINEVVIQHLNESYKLTFDDKREIDKEIRKQYEKYVEDIESHNKEIKLYKNYLNSMKETFSDEDYNVFLTNFGHYLNAEPVTPMRFNKFYNENIEYVKDIHIDRNSKNVPTNFEYQSRQEKNLKQFDFQKFYDSLTETEKKSITKFLNIVSIRVSSGTGESIDRIKVRNSFFKTPIKFQQMFSEKPNGYLWRGDYTHPCNPDYNHNDTDYLAMQSFSTYKKVAKEFGIFFNASNIKSYSGSFSLPLFSEYGGGSFYFGDDEGEVMFFDVVYKCADKPKLRLFHNIKN